ncbi:hypothetical protein Glove_116g32 [Diversispora epigaea]|uniref:Protein kinase domain-containing protein n=1 Tax=Diversispora epigaea TaxID=1348612 RepID=A0A397J5C2_9GLOM|nr:hypothetical protein Glove_116g32 [Diversispora epigaea]
MFMVQPYIPPKVLRGNGFTNEGDVYSFGGIMYEMGIGFVDQAHDNYLIYQCWDNPSKRPENDF